MEKGLVPPFHALDNHLFDPRDLIAGDHSFARRSNAFSNLSFLNRTRPTCPTWTRPRRACVVEMSWLTDAVSGAETVNRAVPKRETAECDAFLGNALAGAANLRRFLPQRQPREEHHPNIRMILPAITWASIAGRSPSPWFRPWGGMLSSRACISIWS